MLERPPIHYPELSLTLSLSILAHRDGRGGGGRGPATLRYMPGTTAAATSSMVRPSTAAAAAPGAGADSNSDTSGVAAVMGIRIAPPEERACFHHLTGWLCDDSVTLDFICM